MGYNRHDILEEKMCEEIKAIEKKYENVSGEMAESDVKRLDLLYHTLKSKATYDAMKDAEEYGYDHGQMSGRRGYSPRMSGGYYPEQNYPEYPPHRW